MGATGTRPGGLTLSHQQWAWVFVLLFFVLGDVVTTSVGLSLPGIEERNTVLRPVVENLGIFGMVAAKALILGTGYVISCSLPEPKRLAIPLAILTVGILVTGWNIIQIFLSL